MNSAVVTGAQLSLVYLGSDQAYPLLKDCFFT